MTDRFEKDCLEILEKKVARGEISRRRFAQIAAFLIVGAPAALKAKGAMAAADELVFVNWGGDAGTAYDKAYGAPFKEETGITVKQDGSGPTEGAVQAQFESGSPTWDIVDIDPFSAEALGKKGMMEPIDYAIVDKAKMRPGFGWEYAASSYFFSYIIAYDASKFGDKVPTGMADFFDVEKFPGKRSLYKWGAGMWEAALLADGVPADKLYPLDLDRAHKKIADFKDNIVSFWGGGSESQSVLLNGEASMALIWSTRASLIEKDSGDTIKFVWDQGLISPGAMGVIKGNPGGKENAMKFIASAQVPEKQVIMFDMLGQGPANPAADALLNPEQARLNPVDPANMSKQIPLDMAWYETNYGPALDAYTKVISA
ncbi:ABC transporter substrate-binding protein [Rhizobium sp. TRM96647]|uniref:ABC transporter substrate-binding protein n=1 Tax=unclassified Rhizobium TaxID=2613769 RepID=UPI0021E99D51|nr:MULTISPECIES: ABC transporter substrate-binding protein [unclassified Rhizobium]MCV3734602.1 ABC transporter substrate-binding protein [Rhizobium sp. TRM96647]MCV3756972.1 ABC transporter substrate-binding protein [Rhizobium sp. TRM96650]